jgi:hypothetical protein
MAEQGRPRRRRRWIVPLVAVGAGVWFVRTRRIPVQGTWVPPMPSSTPAPAGAPVPRHAAATPEAATLDPEPTGEAPKHAATNGSAPPAESAPAEPESNPLFTEASAEPAEGAAPLSDGSAPGPEFVIKGNADSMLFHTESSPYYGRTKAEVWFRTEEEATAAGFTKWTRRRPRS